MRDKLIVSQQHDEHAVCLLAESWLGRQERVVVRRENSGDAKAWNRSVVVDDRAEVLGHRGSIS